MTSQGLRRTARPGRYAGRVQLTRRRAWYADEAGDTPAPQTDGPADGGGDAAEPEQFSREYVQELRKEAARHRTEKQEAKRALEQLEAERKQADEARLAEQQQWQKLAEQRAAEVEAMKATAKAAELNALRLRVATSLGLPPALAERLQGEDEDALRTDAEALKALLPAPAPEPTPGQGPRQTTTVPGGRPAGETDAQRRARIFGGGNGGIFAARQDGVIRHEGDDFP